MQELEGPKEIGQAHKETQAESESEGAPNSRPFFKTLGSKDGT